MNTFVAGAYSERSARLALGIEPVDAGRGTRAISGVEVGLDDVPGPVTSWRERQPWEAVDDLFPRMQRHSSGHFVLLYRDRLEIPIGVRLYGARRRYVPRRFCVTVPTEAEVVAPETNLVLPPVPVSRRVLRPLLFPGAAYDVSDRATGLRGRVVRAGEHMRWARVQAVVAGTAQVVARAHGDDRGEFLLLVQPTPNPGQVWSPQDPLDLEVMVSGPAVAPTVPPPEDPLGDLPVEDITIADPGASDVERGLTPLATYVDNAGGSVAVAVPLGRITSAGIAPFEFSP